METIDFIIDKEGNIKIEANGFHGPACTLATKAVEELLGGGEDRSLKAEYYQPQVKTGQKIRGG